MTKQAQYSNKYNKENTKTVLIRLNKKTDADIIKILETIPNKQGYIKELIRGQMK